MWKTQMAAWVVAVGFLGFLLSGSASAAPISVTNYNFENVVVADGANNTNGVPGWNTKTVSSWRATCNPLGSDVDPFPSGMVGAYGNGTPLGGDGPNVVLLYQPAGGVGGTLFAAVGTPLLQLGTYTLTVAVGSFNNAQSAGFHLYIGDMHLGYTGGASYAGSGSELTPGRLVDKSVSWTITDPAEVGYMILVAFSADDNTGSTTGHTVFDNVRLDFTPVPEPASMILLGMGCIVCSFRKMRKNVS